MILIINIFSSCAALFNRKKPSLRTDAALYEAEKLGFIRKDNYYIVGDMLLILSPIVGVFAGPLGFVAACLAWPIGLTADFLNKNHYVVIEQSYYDLWKKQYLKKVEEKRRKVIDNEL